MPTITTTISATITQNAPGVETREVDVHPEDAGDERQGQHDTLKIVRTRRTSFWRCEITDSFVDSRPSTTSL